MLHLPTVISLSFILNLIIGLYFISIYQYKKQTSFLGVPVKNHKPKKLKKWLNLKT